MSICDVRNEPSAIDSIAWCDIHSTNLFTYQNTIFLI